MCVWAQMSLYVSCTCSIMRTVHYQSGSTPTLPYILQTWKTCDSSNTHKYAHLLHLLSVPLAIRCLISWCAPWKRHLIIVATLLATSEHSWRTCSGSLQSIPPLIHYNDGAFERNTLQIVIHSETGLNTIQFQLIALMSCRAVTLMRAMKKVDEIQIQ